VNDRRPLRAFFFAIEHSSRIFAPFGVSTEAGDLQHVTSLLAEDGKSRQVRFTARSL
jgi:hypothetical protein